MTWRVEMIEFMTQFHNHLDIHQTTLSLLHLSYGLLYLWFNCGLDKNLKSCVVLDNFIFMVKFGKCYDLCLNLENKIWLLNLILILRFWHEKSVPFGFFYVFLKFCLVFRQNTYEKTCRYKNVYWNSSQTFCRICIRIVSQMRKLFSIRNCRQNNMLEMCRSFHRKYVGNSFPHPFVTMDLIFPEMIPSIGNSGFFFF